MTDEAEAPTQDGAHDGGAAPSTEDIRRSFRSFASFSGRQEMEEMDGVKFAKLCKDCNLYSKTFAPTDVDLVFAKVKTKGARRITFEQFLEALEIIAEKKGCAPAEVLAAVHEAEGPANSGTKADYVKFHDDKSFYTGVHAHGGPTTVDQSKDLSGLLDRSPADVRGVKLNQANVAMPPPA